jgi:transcriptional regulator with XRE-family HTH domain
MAIAVQVVDDMLETSEELPDSLRRRELGDFLRTRRARIAPAEMGLAPGGRRRTPGLRREEVAQLSGVGVTWYTWLEQGRDIRVSEQVLDALARTLRLDPHERLHLFTLAGAPSAGFATECTAVDPTVAVLLDRLDPYPAAVLNRRYDILAFNRGYAALFGDIDALQFDERNLLWLMFTSDAMRRLLGEHWGVVTRHCVAQYRSALAEHTAEPAWRGLVKRLQGASPVFASLWREHDVTPTVNKIKHLEHHDLGSLRFNATNMWLAERTGNRLVVYTPVDDASTEKTERLARTKPLALV